LCTYSRPKTKQANKQKYKNEEGQLFEGTVGWEREQERVMEGRYDQSMLNKCMKMLQ
jgi:hypothetical protein